MSTTNLPATEIGKETIGLNKYNFLKSIPEEKRTAEEADQVKAFEEKNGNTEEKLSIKKRYADKIFSEPEPIHMKITKGWLWRSFLENFKKLNGKEFEQTEETVNNVKAVMLYFLKSDDFIFCQNVNPLSKPSFDKGLLIIGGYGCGKTSIMNALQRTFFGIKGYSFKSYNANEVVKLFESISIDNPDMPSRRYFDQKMNSGDVYFDDVKAEREASNFGKSNLFREIFEIRSQKPFKTYASANFQKEKPGDYVAAVDEFAFKYGERVYDRIFEMFNIIEFHGKSFRK